MPANAIRSIDLTIYGQQIDAPAFAIGETTQLNLTLQNPADRSAFDLTGATVTLDICDLDVYQLPAHPPLVSKVATIVGPATDGEVTVTIASADTLALAPKTYGLDVFVTDASGNKFQILPFAFVSLLPSSLSS